MDKFRWGILGGGNIAAKFAEGLKVVDGAELVAVGSRSQENADRFGDKFAIPNRHASYEALAADPAVDAVYVATPHVFHKANSILCLEAGKHVLCEKPFCVNVGELEEVIAVARREQRFLMEAMWTRFFPVMAKVRELVAEKAIGDVRMVQASFAFRAGWNPEGRLLNPELAGGGLLDVGIYTISFAHMVMGRAPVAVTGLADVGATHVDEQAAYVLKWDRGELAVLSCGVRTGTEHAAVIYGTDGMIKIPPLFWQPRKLIVTKGGNTEEIELPIAGNGYNLEAEEVMNCVRAGKVESDIMPLAESVELMKTMDALRAQWGITYPCER